MPRAKEFGVSFSLHRCSELGLNKKDVLISAIDELGFRRFRLMSYWNIHEQKPGVYDFRELDWQLDLIAKYGGEVSLCVGKRQPRWPECHITKWGAALPKEQWHQALFDYIEVVVKRYKDHPALVSWQLENEALLKDFGYCVDGDYSRKRLKTEFNLIKRLDPNHPIIMTLSDSWGIPLRRPKPDSYAMSLYRITINKAHTYVYSKRPAWFYRTRALAIQLLQLRPAFIHELQTEPWLPKSILEIPIEEQLKYMNPQILRSNIGFANQTGLHPIDLWGLEWWYWLREQEHPEVWQTVNDCLGTS